MDSRGEAVQGIPTAKSSYFISAIKDIIELPAKGDEMPMLSVSQKEPIDSESNWSRLEDDEAQGLLLSLLRMKEQDLGIHASILDANPAEKELQCMFQDGHS